MSSLAELIGNVSTGGLVGLLGGLGTGLLNYFKQKQEHAFKIEEMKLAASLRQVEVAGEITLAREKGAADAFANSQAADAAITGTSTWVANLRGFTRPGLTWLFVFALFAIIAVSIWMPDWLAEAPQLLSFGVEMVVDTTGMMIAWWFGSRQIERQSRTWGNKDASASVR